MSAGHTNGSLPFELRESSIAGVGAFATQRSKKGTRIIEYRVNASPSRGGSTVRRDKMHSHHTSFTLTNERRRRGRRREIHDSSIIRAAKLRGGDRGREAHLHRGADRHPVGTELVYDYQYERTDDHTTTDERFYACSCGAPIVVGRFSPEEEKEAEVKIGSAASQQREASVVTCAICPAYARPSDTSAPDQSGRLCRALSACSRRCATCSQLRRYASRGRVGPWPGGRADTAARRVQRERASFSRQYECQLADLRTSRTGGANEWTHVERHATQMRRWTPSSGRAHHRSVFTPRQSCRRTSKVL